MYVNIPPQKSQSTKRELFLSDTKETVQIHPQITRTPQKQIRHQKKPLQNVDEKQPVKDTGSLDKKEMLCTLFHYFEILSLFPCTNVVTSDTSAAELPLTKTLLHFLNKSDFLVIKHCALGWLNSQNFNSFEDIPVIFHQQWIEEISVLPQLEKEYQEIAGTFKIATPRHIFSSIHAHIDSILASPYLHSFVVFVVEDDLRKFPLLETFGGSLVGMDYHDEFDVHFVVFDVPIVDGESNVHKNPTQYKNFATLKGSDGQWSSGHPEHFYDENAGSKLKYLVYKISIHERSGKARPSPLKTIQENLIFARRKQDWLEKKAKLIYLNSFLFILKNYYKNPKLPAADYSMPLTAEISECLNEGKKSIFKMPHVRALVSTLSPSFKKSPIQSLFEKLWLEEREKGETMEGLISENAISQQLAIKCKFEETPLFIITIPSSQCRNVPNGDFGAVIKQHLDLAGFSSTGPFLLVECIPDHLAPNCQTYEGNGHSEDSLGPLNVDYTEFYSFNEEKSSEEAYHLRTVILKDSDDVNCSLSFIPNVEGGVIGRAINAGRKPLLFFYERKQVDDGIDDSSFV